MSGRRVQPRWNAYRGRGGSPVCLFRPCDRQGTIDPQIENRPLTALRNCHMTPEKMPPAESSSTTPPPSNLGAELALPFTLGGAYEVTDRIGQGGMGDVY